MIDHEYYTDPEEILGWAIALLRYDCARIVARDGSVDDETAFMEFRIEFPKSSRVDKLARATSYVMLDPKRATVPATIFKSKDGCTMQPDSLREWNDALGRFNDCERVLVSMSNNV